MHACQDTQGETGLPLMAAVAWYTDIQGWASCPDRSIWPLTERSVYKAGGWDGCCEGSCGMHFVGLLFLADLLQQLKVRFGCR